MPRNRANHRDETRPSQPAAVEVEPEGAIADDDDDDDDDVIPPGKQYGQGGSALAGPSVEDLRYQAHPALREAASDVDVPEGVDPLAYRDAITLSRTDGVSPFECEQILVEIGLDREKARELVNRGLLVREERARMRRRGGFNSVLGGFLALGAAGLYILSGGGMIWTGGMIVGAVLIVAGVSDYVRASRL